MFVFKYILTFSSGDHIVPNFEEIWPSDKNKDDKYKRRLIGMEYYMDVRNCVFFLLRRKKTYKYLVFRQWRTMD